RIRRARAVLCRRHRSRSLGRGALEADRRQSGKGGSRHQDEGRPARSQIRRRARRGDATTSRRRLSADGGRQHEMDGRGSDPRRPRIRAPGPDLAGEPIIPDDVAGHARIMQAGGVPIAAGENLRSLWEFKNYIAAGAVSYPEPDVTNCGGVSSFIKIARLAEAFNLPVTSHGAHDITVHLLAACPNRSYLEAHGFGLTRYIEHPLLLTDGKALAPDRLGHGVSFDWKRLADVAA